MRCLQSLVYSGTSQLRLLATHEAFDDERQKRNTTFVSESGAAHSVDAESLSGGLSAIVSQSRDRNYGDNGADTTRRNQRKPRCGSTRPIGGVYKSVINHAGLD